MRFKPSPAIAYAMLTLTTFLWSGNWIVGRAFRETMTATSLNFYRWALVVLVLLPFVGLAAWRRRALIRRHWKLIAALALLSSTMFQTGVYFGVSLTQAVNAVIINSTLPAFMVLVSWLAYGERATPRQMAGVLVSFCGVLAIMSRGSLATLLALQFNLGDLILLAIMPLWCFYSNLLTKAPSELGLYPLILGMALATVVFLAPFYTWDLAAGRVLMPTPDMVLGMLYVAIPATAVAYPLWNISVHTVGPNRAGFFIHLMPVFGTLMAITLLGEAFRLFHLAGIALIFAGVALSTLARQPATRAAQARSR